MSASKSAKPNKQHGNANPARPSSSASNRRDQVYDTFNVALDVTANIAEGSDILAPLKAVCRATKSILEVMQAIESNKEEWADLTRRLTEYISTFEEQITLLESYPQSDRAISKAFTRHLDRYVELLKDIHSTVVNLREKRSRSKLSLLTGFSKFKIDVEEIRKFNRDIEDRHRQLMSALSIFIAAHVQALERNADASTILQLPTVAFIASSVHRTCLNGTREAVLQMIGRWANDTTSEKPIFWLCDIAGSGKSTVAMSAVETWQKEGVLGGRFFFSMASSEGSTTDKFCSTIARDLVHYIPELTPHVAESMKQNPAFMRSSLEEQFRTLVTGPLHHRQQHVILVIDAVDECKSGSHRKEILEVLSGAVRENKNLKILMTSRPDPIIEEVLGPLSIKSKMEGRLHDSSHRDNVNDIAVYVHGSLGEVLSEDKKQKLVEKANGLFIWASTACRLLTSKTSFSSPEDTYDRLISMEQTGAIDDVYDLVLERTDPEHRSVMCTMLALLLAAFEPLTLDDLNDILKHNRMRGSAKALVQNLGSILASDATTNLIQFRHPTIVEYLRRRSIAPSVGSNKVHVNITNAHGQAASWCLNRLKLPTEGLKFNICQIESSFYLNRQIPDLDARISKSIPRRLRYASFHWLFHVAETNEKGRSMLRKELQHAIQVPRVFYWMEVLSLTGGVSRAIDGLRALTRHAGLERDTASRMNEVRRFIMAFSVPIQDSTPHIYISALPFTPIKTALHLEGLREYTNTLNVTRGLEEVYPGLPSSLEGHKYAVRTVAFSPNGSRIVSGSDDKTVRMWDADTGQPLGNPIQGHKGGVNSVAFSPDGSQIASGSDDNTVRLWDANSGQPIGEPLRGHEAWIWAVAFSPDGSRIVSGSSDKTICLWDAVTRQPLGEPLRGHDGRINSVSFSPDGSQIASGSDDKTVRVWDAHSGQLLGEPLQGHNDTVRHVKFSPDGLRIISASDDWTMCLWDVATRQPLGDPLRGHDGGINSVSFSPDGSQIASGSDDNTVRLWDANSGQPLGEPLRGHEAQILAVAFSPDGSQIVSGSSDKTICLWDAATRQPLGESFRGHDGGIIAVSFSPNGSQIASGSDDGTVRLWDVDNGQPLGEPLRGHNDTVQDVKISPDGLRIISASDDETICVWDAATHQPLGEPLQGHDGGINSVSFSPNGLQIASGSDDNTVRLWDANSGQPIGEPLRGHEDRIWAVAFSPDGSRIVSGSSDKTICLWDAVTRQPLGEPLRGHDGRINSLSFSPDGSQIASASDDGTIRLWEADTGQPLGEPLRGHEAWIWAVAFSPDGSRIVSGSSDKTIRLWDASTGQPLGEPLRGHEGRVMSVAFSLDGSKIVSGSDDKTIRLWDAAIDSQPQTFGRDATGSNISPQIVVPGFEGCSLQQYGWVQSSGKLLFWVPPDNRHGLLYPHLLTMPTTSVYRATKFDFSRFQCGLSWTNVRKDAM